MSKLVGIDATTIFCPEFTTPVMSLIKKHIPKGGQGVIKTKESRALLRTQHLCASFDWEVIGYQESCGDYLIVVQC
jgi:hypothetical protein